MAKHMGGDPDAIAYFSQGVEIIDLQEPANLDKARAWLNKVFKSNMVDYIMDAEKSGALHEFYLKTYVNYS